MPRRWFLKWIFSELPSLFIVRWGMAFNTHYAVFRIPPLIYTQRYTQNSAESSFFFLSFSLSVCINSLTWYIQQRSKLSIFFLQIQEITIFQSYCSEKSEHQKKIRLQIHNQWKKWMPKKFRKSDFRFVISGLKHGRTQIFNKIETRWKN